MNLVLEDDLDLDQEYDIDTLDCILETPNSAHLDIQRYFEKQEFDQNKIDEIIEKFSEFVSSTTLIQAVSIAYNLIEKNNYCDTSCQSQSAIPEDVRFVVSLIHKVQKIVSQDFVGGILVLHLIFIEGLKCDGLIG